MCDRCIVVTAATCNALSWLIENTDISNLQQCMDYYTAALTLGNVDFPDKTLCFETMCYPTKNASIVKKCPQAVFEAKSIYYNFVKYGGDPRVFTCVTGHECQESCQESQVTKELKLDVDFNEVGHRAIGNVGRWLMCS